MVLVKKAVIYTRVSTEKQEQQNTIESQINQLVNFAENNNFQIIEHYSDNGYSGTILNRPDLDKLINDSNSGDFKYVLVLSMDRLARSSKIRILLTEILQERGLIVVYATNPQVDDTPSGKLMGNVISGIAEYERDIIIERMMRGKINKAKKGIVVGGRSPYGYIYVPKSGMKNGYYKIHKEEAVVVKLIFHLYVNSRMTIRGIVKELFRRRINPRNSSKKWAKSTVARIISNESYTGTTYYYKHRSIEGTINNSAYSRLKNTRKVLRNKKEWIPIKIPSIISKDTYLLAQKLRKQNFERSKRNQKYFYLLSGLLVCSNCNSPFYSSPCHGKRYYRCSNREKRFPESKDCYQPSIKAAKVEYSVIHSMKQLFSSKNRLLNHIDKSNKIESEEALTNNDKLKELKDETNRLISAYREGIISLDDLKYQKHLIDTEIDQINSKNKSNTTVKTHMNKSLIESFRVYAFEIINSNNKRQLALLIKEIISKIVISSDSFVIYGRIPTRVSNKKALKDCQIKSISSCLSGLRAQGRQCLPSDFRPFFP